MIKLAVTGIGTGVGKTVASAIIAEAINAAYWKPIQAGDLDFTDSMTVRHLSPEVTVLPEKYLLSKAMSPHAAAAVDDLKIELNQLALPDITNNLVVEGAGGLMVPLNSDGLLFADVFDYWNLPVVIVSRHYLGSINHTLLTLEVLKNRQIPVHGVLFNGDENQSAESIIASKGVRILGRIPEAISLDRDFIRKQAEILKPSLCQS